MRHKDVILVVEEDPFLGELVTAALQLHNPSWLVCLAPAPEAALLVLRQEPVRVIVTETCFDGKGEDFSFLAVLAGWDPPLAAVLIGRKPPADIPIFLSGSCFLPKPAQLDDLLGAVDHFMQLRQDSVLNGIDLEQVLQMLGHDHKSCTLTVSSGLQTGRIHVENGQVISARLGTQDDREAVLNMLAVPRCVIRLSELAEATATIRLNIQDILMESCLRKDRAHRVGTLLHQGIA